MHTRLSNETIGFSRRHDATQDRLTDEGISPLPVGEEGQLKAFPPFVMRRRAHSISGVRRHRLLILLLPLLVIFVFLYQGGSSQILGHHGSHPRPEPAKPKHPAPQRPSIYRISKVSMLFGQNEIYQRALETHRRHNEIYEYGMHVLREPITDGYWNKLAYIMSLLVQELAKPASERVEWFM